MTVSSVPARSILLGNGATQTWSCNFEIPSTSAVAVIQQNTDSSTTLVSSSLYTIVGAGAQSGFAITYPLTGPLLQTGQTLVAYRTVPYTQPTTLTNVGPFDATVVMGALDNLAFEIQQLLDASQRSVVAPVTDVALVQLPAAALRANKILGFDTTGQVAVSGIFNTASGSIIVETASTTVNGIGTIKFVSGASVTSTISGEADVTITQPPIGVSPQITFNNAGTMSGFTMSGDVTVSLPGGTASLSTTGASAGTYTNATVTIDAKGRVTTASTGATGAGAYINLGTLTAATSASLAFTTQMTSSYDVYELTIEGLRPATDGAALYLEFSTNSGSTWIGSNNYGWSQIIQQVGTTAIVGASSNPDNQIVLFSTVSKNVAASVNLGGTVRIYNVNSTTLAQTLHGDFWSWSPDTGGTAYQVRVAGYLGTQAAMINALRLIMSSGNITVGTARLYGLSN